MCRSVLYRLFAAWFVVFVLPVLTCAADTMPGPEDAFTETGASIEGSERVPVFYMTNRKYHANQPIAGSYNGERGGEVHFGRCEVEFTPIPIINHVAPKIPFYIQSETRAISLTEQTDPPTFWEQFRDVAGSTSTGSVVLFVHGYNYGFERTCHMAAEMQRYLQDKATILVFSWPSNGLPSDYVRDQADIEWSVPLLANTISQLGKLVGRENVRIMAHSLGSRGVIQALQRLRAGQGKRPLIEDLVLLAPDFDSQTFVELMPDLAPLASGITLYASVNDTPLKLSRQLSGYPRLGEAGKFLTVIEGVETIDVSSVGRYQVTGHEYFYFHPRVTADLVTLLGIGVRASGRTGLTQKDLNGISYWEFTPVESEARSGNGD